jgi:hypothetical protein
MQAGYYWLQMEILSTVGGKGGVRYAGCQLHFTRLTAREVLMACSRREIPMSHTSRAGVPSVSSYAGGSVP